MRNRPHIFIGEVLVASLLVVLVCTTFVQVISRYVLNYSLPWADELARTSLVWVVFCGMVVCLARGQHAYVGMLVDGLEGRARRIALTVIDVMTAILFAVVLYGGIRMIILTSGQTTSGLGISRGVIYAAVPLGSSLMLVELALRIYRRFTGRTEEALP